MIYTVRTFGEAQAFPTRQEGAGANQFEVEGKTIDRDRAINTAEIARLVVLDALRCRVQGLDDYADLPLEEQMAIVLNGVIQELAIGAPRTLLDIARDGELHGYWGKTNITKLDQAWEKYGYLGSVIENFIEEAGSEYDDDED